MAQGCCQGRSVFLLLTDGLDLSALHSTKGFWAPAMPWAPWHVLGGRGCQDGSDTVAALSGLTLGHASPCDAAPLPTQTLESPQNVEPEFHFDEN